MAPHSSTGQTLRLGARGGGDKDFGVIVDSDDCKYDKKKERVLRLGDKCEAKGIRATKVPMFDYNRQKLRERPERREDTKDLRARLASQLVVSSKRSHTATELCESETSLGPDFVSTEEGVFCSMSQKKTFPICGRDSDPAADACFDLEANALVMPQPEDTAHTKRIREELPATNYSLVCRW